MNRPVTIGVLTYGDHEPLVRRAVTSILERCPRNRFELVVGANAPGPATRAYLESLRDVADRILVSERNVNKCPMMRRMFEGAEGDFLWWFDDDSWVEEPGALDRWLDTARNSSPETAMWGHVFFAHEEDFSFGEDVKAFVRRAPWFRGLPPPSREPGGDPRWFFCTGGLWMIRASAYRALEWPDPALVKRADDVFLGEAVRQRGWTLRDVGELGVRINRHERRGVGEDAETMRQQMGARREGG
jgi:glycosyltransferase involved in cell wall biosynthesis